MSSAKKRKMPSKMSNAAQGKKAAAKRLVDNILHLDFWSDQVMPSADGVTIISPPMSAHAPMSIEGTIATLLRSFYHVLSR